MGLKAPHRRLDGDYRKTRSASENLAKGVAENPTRATVTCMLLPLRIVNAFTQRKFGGNPAAVCPLPCWLPDASLQAMAQQHNLSETAYLVPLGQDGAWHLRWFTPTFEIALCGHATLASAYVLFSDRPDLSEIRFQTRSGWLLVTREGGRLRMDFPQRSLSATASPAETALFPNAREVLVDQGNNLFVVLADEAAVLAFQPDELALRRLDRLGAIVTAEGVQADFVSRYFAPAAGISEDAVTGSAHCSLVPYWADRLGREELLAWQVSRRKGEIWCRRTVDRVHLSGYAVLYARGEIDLTEEN